MNNIGDLGKINDQLRGVLPLADIQNLSFITALAVFKDLTAMENLITLSADKIAIGMAEFTQKQELKSCNTRLFKLIETSLPKILKTFIELRKSCIDQLTYGIKVCEVLKQFYICKDLTTTNNSENFQNLFKAIIGSCKDKILFDSHCGNGLNSLSLSANKSVLRDMNQFEIDNAKIFFELNGLNLDIKAIDILQSLEESYKTDVVVSIPPLGQRISGLLVKDKPFILHPDVKTLTSSSENLYIQHAVYQLNETGKAYLGLVPGWLFRGGYDATLRKYLIENDLIDAVILLPRGTLESTGIEMCLLILNKNKKHEGIRMVDARKLIEPQRCKIIIDTEKARYIADLLADKKEDSTLCKTVSIQDIRAKNFSLYCAEYFEVNIQTEHFNHIEEIKTLQQAQEQYLKAQDTLNQLLTNL